MLIHHDDADWEPVSSSSTCDFHKEHPGASYAGCTCSASFGLRRRDRAEADRIKAERARKHEDDILKEADAIRARRGL